MRMRLLSVRPPNFVLDGWMDGMDGWMLTKKSPANKKKKTPLHPDSSRVVIPGQSLALVRWDLSFPTSFPFWEGVFLQPSMLLPLRLYKPSHLPVPDQLDDDWTAKPRDPRHALPELQSPPSRGSKQSSMGMSNPKLWGGEFFFFFGWSPHLTPSS